MRVEAVTNQQERKTHEPLNLNQHRQKRQCLVISKFFYTFALSNNDKEIINDLKKRRNMKDLICNVELNGEGVWAQLKGDFSYSEFACNTVVNADVVSQTAQQIYDAVNEDDYRNAKYAVRITANFKDDYLKGLIDADYSTEFIPVTERKFYERNDYEYPYGIEDAQVEYDEEEIEYCILSEYKHFYDCDNGYIYENLVNEKLYEMGFNKLCREKGIEVEIKYAKIEDINISYDEDSFLFETYVILNVSESDY